MVKQMVSFSKCKHLQVGNALFVRYNLMALPESCSHVDNEQDLAWSLVYSQFEALPPVPACMLHVSKLLG